MKYVICIILMIIGIMITIKSEWVYQAFGRVGWFEDKLGLYGGSRLFYKFFGIIVVLGSLFYMTGIFQKIITSIFFAGQI
jgi:hypothetical protein